MIKRIVKLVSLIAAGTLLTAAGIYFYAEKHTSLAQQQQHADSLVMDQERDHHQAAGWLLELESLQEPLSFAAQLIGESAAHSAAELAVCRRRCVKASPMIPRSTGLLRSGSG